MSDRPFTELLDRLEQGEVLDALEIRCLVADGRSYVRMLWQADEAFERHCEIQEADGLLVMARIERLTEERDLLRQELRDRAEHSPACERRQLARAGGSGLLSAGNCGLDELIDLR